MLAQLPSVQLDVVTEDTQRVYVANRNPQPGEVQVPPGVVIQFDVFGTLVELQTTLVIRVDDVVVFDHTTPGLQAGWISVFQTQFPGDTGFRFGIRPPQPFANGALVRMEVQIGVTVAFWVFATYDVMPPLARSVSAINKDQLKVTFSEPVVMGDELNLAVGDALNPHSYMIERRSQPAATPPVTRVDYVSPTEVTLTTGFELSFGAQYTLVVSGVSDEFGNTFLPPNNTCDFDGYLPPYPDGRRWLLHDFVPRIAISIDNGDLQLFLGCLQDTNNILLHAIDSWLEIIDPDTAPEAFVDAMLIDLGNPFDIPLTLSQKRRLAKVLVLIYRLKGTALGIINVVRFFVGIEVTIQTFVDTGWIIRHHQLNTTHHLATKPAIVGPGQHALYCFRVLTNEILTEEQEAHIRVIALYMKGAQEHFVGIRDGKPLPDKLWWWIVKATKIGYSHVSHGSSAPVAPDPNTLITSFTLAAPGP